MRTSSAPIVGRSSQADRLTAQSQAPREVQRGHRARAGGGRAWLADERHPLWSSRIRLGSTRPSAVVRRPRNCAHTDGDDEVRALNAPCITMEISMPPARRHQTRRDREHEMPEVEPPVGRYVERREDDGGTPILRTSDARGPRPSCPPPDITSPRNPYSSPVARNGCPAERCSMHQPRVANRRRPDRQRLRTSSSAQAMRSLPS